MDGRATRAEARGSLDEIEPRALRDCASEGNLGRGEVATFEDELERGVAPERPARAHPLQKLRLARLWTVHEKPLVHDEVKLVGAGFKRIHCLEALRPVGVRAEREAYDRAGLDRRNLGTDPAAVGRHPAVASFFAGCFAFSATYRISSLFAMAEAMPRDRGRTAAPASGGTTRYIHPPPHTYNGHLQSEGAKEHCCQIRGRIILLNSA